VRLGFSVELAEKNYRNMEKNYTMRSFMSIMYILHKIEENEIDMTCNKHGRQEEFMQI
jgi:hypothetical protein